MAYEKQTWIDQIEDDQGEIIQEGTPMDSVHFSHMEDGIYEANRSEVAFYYDEEGYLCYRKTDEEE